MVQASSNWVAIHRLESTVKIATKFLGLSLQSQQFQFLLTLFSKYFSPFPRGTFTLSVSHRYLAFDEVYHQLCDPITRNATRKSSRTVSNDNLTRSITFCTSLIPKDVSVLVTNEELLKTTIQTSWFSFWANPCSLAATRGILVSFFSTA